MNWQQPFSEADCMRETIKQQDRRIAELEAGINSAIIELGDDTLGGVKMARLRLREALRGGQSDV